jgi:hypothetical protein
LEVLDDDDELLSAKLCLISSWLSPWSIASTGQENGFEVHLEVTTHMQAVRTSGSAPVVSVEGINIRTGKFCKCTQTLLLDQFSTASTITKPLSLVSFALNVHKEYANNDVFRELHH